MKPLASPFRSRRNYWLAVFLAGFFAYLSRLQIVDHDVFLHARYGWWILEHRAVPRTDELSLFGAGKAWIDHEWLAQVFTALASSERIGGFGALCAIRAAILCGAFALSASAMAARGAALAPSLAALFLGFSAVWLFGQPRPYLATYVGLAWMAWAWSVWRFQGRKAFCWLPLGMAVWANCHGGFTAGLLFLAALAAGATLEALLSWWRDRSTAGGGGAADNERSSGAERKRGSWAEAKRLWLLLGLSVLACCMNPFGAAIFLFPFKVVGQEVLERVIFEWQPSTLDFEFWPFAVYAALLGFALLRKPKAVCAADWLAALMFLWMACGFRRHIPLLVFATAPLLAERLGDWTAGGGKPRRLARVGGRATRLPRLGETTLAAVFLGGALWTQQMVARGYMPMGRGVNEKAFPVKAMDFLLQSDLRPSLFHSYNCGGYVAWRARPPWRHFIDGRADLYGAEGIKRYFSYLWAKGDWRRAFDSYDPPIRTILLDYDMTEKIPALAETLWASPDWALAYWDDFGMIYARREKNEPPSLARLQYRRINPLWTPARVSERNPPGPKREELVAELNRKLREDPSSTRAMGFLSYTYSLDGRFNEAEALCRRIIALQPRAANTHLLLGKILEKQKLFGDAEREYREALRLKPELATAWTRLGTLYERRGEVEKALARYRRGMAADPSNADAVFNAVRATAKLDRASESLALWRRYVELASPDSKTLESVAEWFDELGAPAEAENLRARAKRQAASAATASRKAIESRPSQ